MHAVELRDVSKKYNIYDRPADRLKELVLPKKNFHREFMALTDVNADFEQGTTTALLGANGSGKSTMLQIIAGVLQPSTGSVKIRGRLTAILELGAGFQMDHTGRENVMLNGMILGVPMEEMEHRLEEIAEFAEIGDFFDQPVKTYSSGMIVRLAFAAAISVDPEILLVDEALAVGDSRFQHKCVMKIQALQAQGKTIIFVSHDLNVVKIYCNQAILLDGGKVIAAGDTLKVVDSFVNLMDNGTFTRKTFTQAGARESFHP
jgi:ABC-type polysaccharide/polyol phosphate transport system ATPase subunit